MNNAICLLLFVCAALLTSCQHFSPPVAIDYASVCQRENNGKYLETTGRFGVSELVFCSDRSGRNECTLGFFNAETDARNFSAAVAEGTGANQMEPLSRRYTEEEIKIRAADNALIKLTDKVKITGVLSVTPLQNDPSTLACTVKVERIEKQ